MIDNMKFRFKIFLIIISVLLANSELFSQGGSNYSIFGIGDIYNSSGSFYEGLGGSTAAVPSRSAINLKNPALWGLVDKTRLQVGYNFNQRISITENSTLFQNNGKVNSILGLFAIDSALGLSVSFGMYPYSSVNYMIDSPIQILIDDVLIEGKTSFTGKGGISLAYIGASSKLANNLWVGASVFGLFGNSKTTIVTQFYEASYHSSASYKQDFFNGLGFRGGLYYQAAYNYGFGAFVETVPSFSVESNIRYQSVMVADTNFKFNDKYDMAPALGVGANYASGIFMFTADAQMQDFSGFKYNTGANTKFRKNLSFSLGVQRMGSGRYSASLLDKSSYNFGIGYKQLYYSFRGTDINELWASFGMELPIVNNLLIDYSLVLGTRGTADNGLVRELFGKLTIDLNIGELWFVPYRR